MKRILILIAVVALSVTVALFFNKKSDESAEEANNSSTLTETPSSQVTTPTHEAPLNIPPAQTKIEESKSFDKLSPPSRSQRYAKMSMDDVIKSFEENAESIAGARDDEELVKALSEAYSLAPTREDLKGAQNVEHQTPSFIMHYGAVLDAIANRPENESKRESPVSVYFNDCAADETLVAAVRTMCIYHLVESAAKRGDRIDESRFDSRLLENAKILLRRD